jgi:hypothetical protein
MNSRSILSDHWWVCLINVPAQAVLIQRLFKAYTYADDREPPLDK